MGNRELAKQRSHHCAASFDGPSLSSEGGRERVSIHLSRAPGPPRTCSFLASFVSSSESAEGEISGSVGCSELISNGVMELCRERALRFSSENASGP